VRGGVEYTGAVPRLLQRVARGRKLLAVAALLGAFAPSAAFAGPAAGSDDGESLVARALHIRSIRIVGREQVSTRQIRSVLRAEDVRVGSEILWPEDPRIEAVRDRLRATGYFKRVTVRFETIEGSDDEVILVVDLEERSSVVVSEVDLGSSRMTPFRGGLAVAERNLLGRAIHLGGAFIWGARPRIDKARRQQAYRVDVEAPRLGSAPMGAFGSGWFVSAGEPYRVEGSDDDPNPALFRSYDYDRLGGVVGLSFPLRAGLSIDAGYRFERVAAFLPDGAARARPEGTSAPVVFDLRDGPHRHTAGQFGILWDGREDVFLAGQGGRFALDVQASSVAVGSQYDYVKIVAGGAYSFRLPWRHWITPSATGGQIAGDAPVFERFYSGDLSRWTPGREQGLRYSTRNPIDVFGSGIDTREFGSLFGKFELEYAWPLFRRTRTRVVYGGDLVIAAGVFTLAGDRRERAARRDAGQRVAPVGFDADIGLRLDTAIGTFNVSVGNVLRRTPL
jgi:outer membrane protein assembly factor BamA